ncbi:MAG: hypothetical protein WAV20_15870, partial [Blastocatellia bacterium]
MSVIMMSTCLRRWCAPASVPVMDRPETFEACGRAPLLAVSATKSAAQVKVMIKQIHKTSPSIAAVFLLSFAAVGQPAGSQAPARAQAPAPPPQVKTVLLDVPSIAERVNEVVVNVRSLSESGENLGSGFIIDQRGFIATNFHLISNAEPRRGSGQRGPEPKGPPKLVN